jgi:hypothetical protein
MAAFFAQDDSVLAQDDSLFFGSHAIEPQVLRLRPQWRTSLRMTGFFAQDDGVFWTLIHQHSDTLAERLTPQRGAGSTESASA